MLSSRGLLCLAISVSACTAGGSEGVASTANGGCVRAPAKEFAVGDTLVLKEEGPFPCSLEFVASGISLTADDVDKVPDIQGGGVRDSRGRYYTSTGFGEITVWESTGKVLQTIGHKGDGPGELPGGLLALFLTTGDTLYAAGLMGRWTVFGPDYSYVRTVQIEGMFPQQNSLVTDAGILIVADQSMEQDWMPLPAGTILRSFNGYDVSGRRKIEGAASPFMMGPTPHLSFGDFTAAEVERSAENRSRVITKPVNGKFWAGPPAQTGRGYVLEQWSVDGKLLRTIRREVPWFPPGSDLAEVHVRGGIAKDDMMGAMFGPLSRISSLQDDGTGLLYLLVRTSNAKYDRSATMADSVKFEKNVMEGLDYRLEVIDAGSGQLLVSHKLDRTKSDSSFRPLHGFYGASWSGYWRGESEDGSPKFTLGEMKLVPRKKEN